MARPRTALGDAKALVTPGTVWLSTNHYINAMLDDNDGYGRSDKSGTPHPSFGVDLERTVDRVNSSRVYFTNGSYLDWPKAAQVEVTEDGIVSLFGGGAGQAPADLFVVLRPKPATGLCRHCNEPLGVLSRGHGTVDDDPYKHDAEPYLDEVEELAVLVERAARGNALPPGWVAPQADEDVDLHRCANGCVCTVAERIEAGHEGDVIAEWHSDNEGDPENHRYAPTAGGWACGRCLDNEVGLLHVFHADDPSIFDAAILAAAVQADEDSAIAQEVIDEQHATALIAADPDGLLTPDYLDTDAVRFSNGAVPIDGPLENGVVVLIEDPERFPWTEGEREKYRNATEDEYLAWKAHHDAQYDTYVAQHA